MLLPQQPDPAAAWQTPNSSPPVPTSTIMSDLYAMVTQADQQRTQQEAAQADAESQALTANRAQIDKSQAEQGKMSPAEQQEESGKYWRSTMTGAKPTFAQNMQQQSMDSSSQQALIEEQRRQQDAEEEPAKKAAPTPAPDDTATKAKKATPAPTSTVGNDYVVDQPVPGSEESIPFYEEGTPSVPQTGPAIVHQGEKIVPAEQNPDNPENPNLPTGGSESGQPNHIVGFPDGTTASFPASLSPEHLAAAAHAVYNVAHDATTTAWDEVKSQAKGLRDLVTPPAPDAPADERHVSMLGPVSLMTYRMGKQIVSAVTAAHLASVSGESPAGVKLEAYRNLPVVGDLVRSFEQGKTTEGVTRGLVRAAILKGTADLSSTALAKLSPEAEAAAVNHPLLAEAEPKPVSSLKPTDIG